jgi:phospholipid-binding lipoprotein MlaA
MTLCRKASAIAWFRGSLAGLALLVLQGCASAPNANPRDPWESFNRQVYGFNEGLDEAVVKPVAIAYQDVTPALLRTGVSNFFGNLSDIWSLVNNVLQLKPKESVETLARVGVNTTIGLAGVLDVATELKLQKHSEDFGQTLGRWGVPTGPYLVLPLLGPSTLRDTAALPVNWRGNLVGGVDDSALRNSMTALRVIDLRAGLLRTSRMIDSAALDKYSFTRDAYLQRRRSLIRGNIVEPNSPPEERYDLPEPVNRTAPGGTSNPSQP